MPNLSPQRKAQRKYMREIKAILIKGIREVLSRMAKMKKYQGKKIGFISGMGTFFLYADEDASLNAFNLIGRLEKVVSDFGYFYTSKERMMFFVCEAIPDGHIWINVGDKNKIEGKLL
jgi:hypothetical protein